MEINFYTFLIVCPFVFIAGLIDAIAGGGGLISLPAYMIAGLPAHNAIATNKLSSCLGTLIATWRFLKNKYVIYSLIAPTIILALIGSTLGAKLTLLIDEKYLQIVLLAVLPVVAFFVLFKKEALEKNTSEEISATKRFIICSLAAFLIGTYDGFYGPGTGTFIVIIFTTLAHMDVTTANGNAKCINLASNLAALVTFIFSGKVLFTLGLCAAVFNMLGNYIGSGMAIKNGTKIVRPIILFVLVLLFAKIILG